MLIVELFSVSWVREGKVTVFKLIGVRFNAENTINIFRCRNRVKIISSSTTSIPIDDHPGEYDKNHHVAVLSG
jgi:hypothetical protein